MTREEEIHKAAEEFAFSDKTDTSDFHCAINDFYYGAKWADETIIEKACEWLKEELMDNRDNFGYPVVSTFDTITLNEFIEEFKKAIK